MREIKCRGLNTKGEWVYGSLINTTHGIAKMPHTRTKTWIVESAFGNGGWFNVTRKQYVKPETVGQFTGAYDEQGEEIWEGDIYWNGDDEYWPCFVAYNEKEGCFITESISGGHDYFYTLQYDNYVKVGNIHQNQELLSNG